MSTQLTAGGTTNLDALAVAGAASIGGALSLATTPSISTAQSMVRVNTFNAFGSTNTAIVRFTNIGTNQGGDITYADSATLGGAFTVNTNGVYAISYTCQPGVSSVFGGISLNTTQPTVSIASLSNQSERLAHSQTFAAGASISISWTGYLASGSIIRAHNEGSGATAAQLWQFTIVRVA